MLGVLIMMAAEDFAGGRCHSEHAPRMVVDFAQHFACGYSRNDPCVSVVVAAFVMIVVRLWRVWCVSGDLGRRHLANAARRRTAFPLWHCSGRQSKKKKATPVVVSKF